LKWCTSCEQWKDAAFFFKNPATPDGLSFKCTDCESTYHKQHYLDSKEQYRDAHAKSRAKKLGALCTEHEICNRISRLTVWGRDEGCCRVKLVCNGDYLLLEDMTIDHIVPYVVGGKHCWYNVQTSCLPCNRARPRQRYLSLT
jgi:hypothetical protein